MDTNQSTIRAFNKVLSQFHPNEDERDFPEKFAIKRFHKKFEEPLSSSSKERRAACWQSWLDDDRRLHNISLPSGVWYRVRHKLHQLVSNCKFDSVEFPSGSEFTSTKGRNSVEARLCSSDWTCTYDNFELFARLCYHHKALKRAVARRYHSWFASRHFVETERFADLMLYKHFGRQSPRSRIGFDIFVWKLQRIVTFTQGSRFYTVPKNNEKDRPINIEPFGNILAQLSIGCHLRKILKESYGVDLDNLAGLHRIGISDDSIATIDLSNASDSVALSLVEFLFPRGFYDQIKKSRSPFVLGPDGFYHQIKKVSSMGNGFTFELMTLILTTVCRELDPGASVFGDDIIIAKHLAPCLIKLLEEVGFVVNIEKSFVDGPFRESCGANYHDDFGYIESFDFRWAENIHDCIVISNKVSRLAMSYRSFRELETALQRCIPDALRGGENHTLLNLNYLDLIGSDLTAPGRSNYHLGEYFHTRRRGHAQPSSKVDIDGIRENLHLQKCDVSWFYGYTYLPELRSSTVRNLQNRKHWAKYEMYLHSGLVSKDILTGSGRWAKKLYVRLGDRIFRYDLIKSSL